VPIDGGEMEQEASAVRDGTENLKRMLSGWGYSEKIIEFYIHKAVNE
jgi:hypothetical protein